MNAAGLREALAVWHPDDPLRNNAMLDAIVDAARTIALPILEADPRKVWWCAGTWFTYDVKFPDCDFHAEKGYRCGWQWLVPLAAISTPTPGGQES